MKKTLILLLTSFLFIGCTQRLLDLTLASTKTIDTMNLGIYTKLPGARVRGQDLARIIFVIPTGSPNLKEAIDDTIEREPSAVGLADVVVYRTEWYIPFIYGEVAYDIEGTPIVLKKSLSKEK